MGARGVERFTAVRHIGVCRGDAAPHMMEPVVLTDQCEKAMPDSSEVLKFRLAVFFRMVACVLLHHVEDVLFSIGSKSFSALLFFCRLSYTAARSRDHLANMAETRNMTP